MRNKIARSWAAPAIFALLGPGVATAQDETSQMEEITVTGSYIKRDNFDLASPISVIDAVDIEEAGTPNTADILWEQPFNVGTQIIATPHNRVGAQGGESAQAAVGFGNLRGLGPNATLDLMDGRRLPFGDANFNYPQIALERIETLLDGASALYGTEAIAGVINYVPRKTFDGFKVRYERRDLVEFHAPDEKLGLLWGANSDRASAMFALEYRHAERLEQYNFPNYMGGCNFLALDPGDGNCFDTALRGTDGNSGFPGAALRPIRNADGDLMKNAAGEYLTRRRPSPGCGHTYMNPVDEDGNPIQATRSTFGGVGRGNDDPTVQYANRWGIPHRNGRDCGMSMNYMLDYQGEIPRFVHGYTRVAYDLTDDLTIWSDLMFGQRNLNTRAWPSPHVNMLEPLTVVGDNPGNPYRAFADADGDGLYDEGEQFLYAQDNCNFIDCSSGDGMPDRGADGNGDGIADDLNGDGLPDPAPALQGQWGQPVLLAGTPGGDADGDGIEDRFDPDAGVAFNNDITLNRWSPFSYGHLQSLPDYTQAGGWGLRDREESNLRLGAGFDFDVPETTWNVEGSFVWGERQRDYASAWGSTYNGTLGNLLSRVNCVRNESGDTPLGVASDCLNFNPFITSQFPIVDYVPQDMTTPEMIEDPETGEMIENPAFNNEEEVEGVYVENKDLSTDNVKLYDIVATGSLFALPWTNQPVGLAVGGQIRIEDEAFLPNAINESNSNLHGTGFPRTDLREEANDVFAELVIPALESDRFGYLELQLAGRHTDVTYSAAIGNTAIEPNFTKFVPKVAALYQPTDWMSLRASYSEGFVTPAPAQVVGTQREANRNNDDPTCDVLVDNYDIVLNAENGFPDSGCTYEIGGSGVTIASNEDLVDVIGANPNLGPETSSATALGMSFRLLEGDLSLDFNYIDIEFLDEIVSIVQATRNGIEEQRFNNGLIGECGENPSASCASSFRRTWIQTGETDAYIRESEFGPIRRHLGGPDNTTGRFVTAYDMQARYRFSANQIPGIGGNYGSFVASLNATWTEDFIYQPGPTAPIFNGAGYRNDSRGRQPMPNLRMNGALRWMFGDHTARLSFTYHDGVKDLDTTGNLRFANPYGEIDSQAVFNLFYQYRLSLMRDRSPTLISVNIGNVFESQPRALIDSSGIDPVLMGRSPLGRSWTLRIEQKF